MMGDIVASVSCKWLPYRDRIIVGGILTLGIVILLTLTVRVPAASAETNRLLNSDLSAGTSMPDHWLPSRRFGCESFQWVRSKDAPPELSIVYAPGGDAAWTQTVSVPPGWYDLSAELRTQGTR